MPNALDLIYFRVLLPGPEASFLDNLRYLHTFVPLQDIIDTAIIKLSNGTPIPNKMVKLSPYPCWERD